MWLVEVGWAQRELTVQYALTSIQTTADTQGYAIEEQRNTQDGTISMVLTRWAP